MVINYDDDGPDEFERWINAMGLRAIMEDPPDPIDQETYDDRERDRLRNK
jgi:hypothetical protein